MKTIAKILSAGAMMGVLALGGAVMPTESVQAVTMEDRMNTIESNVLTLQNALSNTRAEMRAMKSEQERIWNTLNALAEELASGGSGEELGETVASLTTELGAVKGLVETLTARMETVGGEMASLRASVTEGTSGGASVEEKAQIAGLTAEVESLRAQLTSARENELGADAQIQSLFNQLNSLRVAKASGEMTVVRHEVVSTGGVANTGSVVQNGSVAEAGGVTNAKGTDGTAKIEGVTGSGVGDSAENVEVPVLGGVAEAEGRGDERSQWWWMLPVMGILAFGVLLWWGIPKLAMKLGK